MPLLLAAASIAWAVAGSRAEEPLPAQARAALARATGYLRSIATKGGYLWRYSTDLKERAGERPATPSQIWVQPPGTPSVGLAFLRAHQATGDAQYLEAASGAASALAGGQLESGGWDYLIDFDPEQAPKWYRRTDRGRLPPAEAASRRNVSTFDDDNSQSALRFLMSIVESSKGRGDAGAREIRAALEYGLKQMVAAQYPNGAWPQRYGGRARGPATNLVRRARIPDGYAREHPGRDYSAYYTLNDHTQRDCIRTMLEAHHRFGDAEYLKAARAGGDFLILAQLPAPQAAWAQQYNFDMEPAWARAFEPPAVCSGESAGAIRTLVELYRATSDEKYLAPVPGAIGWLRRSEIAPGTWARLYELTSNRPIYGDRDGRIHHRLDDISEERRRGYAWQGGFGVADAIADYEEARRNGPKAPARAKTRPGRLEAAAREAMGSLDDQGRWVTNGRVETRVFIRNVEALCDYLEGVKAPSRR